jgi:hypothetical protein
VGTSVINRFYVYEHWRPDKDICFWVGKGNGDRAFRFKRSQHYNNIVAKLGRLGMCVEVRMVASGMTEPDALALEVERIAFWRSAGIKLANLTNGGEGTSGLKHTEATRAIMREKRKNRIIVHSEETKRKIGLANSIALKGRKNPEHSARMKGRKHSDAHRKAIADGNRGRIVDAETREKIAAPQRGRKLPAAHVEKLRIAHLGKKQSAETIEKRRASMLKTWNDPEIRARRTAWMNDPVKVARWIASLRAKPKCSPETREKLRKAASRRWDKKRLKEEASCKL